MRARVTLFLLGASLLACVTPGSTRDPDSAPSPDRAPGPDSAPGTNSAQGSDSAPSPDRAPGPDSAPGTDSAQGSDSASGPNRAPGPDSAQGTGSAQGSNGAPMGEGGRKKDDALATLTSDSAAESDDSFRPHLDLGYNGTRAQLRRRLEARAGVALRRAVGEAGELAAATLALLLAPFTRVPFDPMQFGFGYGACPNNKVRIGPRCVRRK